MEKVVKILMPALPNFVYDSKGTQYDLRKDFSRAELETLLKEWADTILARNTNHQ